tara:strand:- start:170685 stop:171662 length:978 start_codon:yes stop_codon:yes gene_type:complete
MGLPRAVIEAEKAAEAAMLALKGNTGEQPTPEVESKKPELTETPEPVKSPVQEQQPAPTSNDDGLDWKHKYDVLKGKFNSSVPALQEKVKQLESQVDNNPKFAQLERESFADKQRISQLEQALQVKEVKPAELELNPYLKEEYGEDFAKAVADTARQENQIMSNKLNELEAKLSGQIQSTQNDVKQTNAVTKMDGLKALISAGGHAFESINDDPMFHEWLSGVDKYSGKERQSLLQHAYDSSNLKLASSFYIDFMGTQKQRFNSNPLSQHVEPVNSNNGQDKLSTNTPFNAESFQELHDKFRRREITEAEFNEKEREFFSALQQR